MMLTINHRAGIIPVCAFFLMTGIPAVVSAQGCSDAGFCTVGPLKPQTELRSREQRISLLLPVGLGDASVFVFTPGIQYDARLSDRWAVQGKLTANYAAGNLGRVSGPGDVFLSATYRVVSADRWKIRLTLGGKIPLGKPDLSSGNNPLPMQYQPSLGTTDLITGLSADCNAWQFSIGWQKNLTGTNSNVFLPETGTMEYPPSNRFRRRSDLLARGSYNWLINKKFFLQGGLLGIYHPEEDRYTDVSGHELSLAGSRGLTLNVTLAGGWQVSQRLQVGFTAGTPVIVRDIRPDGLTRSFVFAPEIAWRF
ncbi:hypothetical protein [Siphonobacter aquaeclarae]|uniref:MetA-pathway of phenol degradation n=1 Tax=Siphonobacter aquaeclarae TaxID=563176 RepID=A0A1G9KCN0_9BACT|nr:hypothetical protein [Siphonobacter aquaeclarae]SDL47194.1 hypothetical protein SAMN04488090_0962 [Siphonobacter aquaeclarae]